MSGLGAGLRGVAGPVELDGGSRFAGMERLAAGGVEDEQDSNADDHDADGDPEEVAGDFFGIEGRHVGNPGLWVRCGKSWLRGKIPA